MEEAIKNSRKAQQPDINIQDRVMDQIKAEDIKMKSPLIFLAQKIGLESVLALAILGGALAVAVILYILKKIGLLKFLQLGMPGIKVLLVSMPYDYIALLLITILLGNYIVRQLSLAHGVKSNFDISAAALLAITFLLGAFFAVNGGEQLLKGFYANRAAPEAIAVTGKIVSASDNQVVIREEDGKSETLVFDNGKTFPYTPEYSIGKVLQAVGNQDPQNPNYFHAENVSCCDAQ